MFKSGLHKLEIILILISLLLFGVCLDMYLTGFPIQKYLFGVYDETGTHEVGKLGKSTGVVRRELQGQSEFTLLKPSSSLYDSDTVITDNQGSALLTLDGGTQLELGPNTMVRLSFENLLTLGGFSRVAHVEVVQGSVTGKSPKQNVVLKSKNRVVTLSQAVPTAKVEAPLPKALPSPVAQPILVAQSPPSPLPTFSPSPSPSPTPSPLPPPIVETVQLITPARGEKLSLVRGTQDFKKEIRFHWKLSPPLESTRIVISRKGKRLVSQDVVLEKLGEADSQGKFKFMANSPGDFEWQISQKTGDTYKSLGKSNFTISREVELIEVKDPLVAGLKVSSNALNEKLVRSFGITLSWQDIPHVSDYRIQISNSPSMSKILLERSVKETTYQLNKNQVYSGRLYYQVSAPLKSGFVAISRVEAFQFSYLPPTLVLPADGAVISKKSQLDSDKKLILTWRSTNFTVGYILEISTDKDFKTHILNTNLADNFYVFKVGNPGTYFWRVQAYAKNLRSAPSQINTLIIAK